MNIQSWIIKAVLIVLFPIGIYVWWSNRSLKKELSEAKAENRQQFEEHTVEKAYDAQVTANQGQQISSLQREAKIRADISNRRKVVEAMQRMRDRGEKHGKN